MPEPTSPISTPPPAAALIGQLLRGSLVTQLIAVAARLGIADLLASGPRTCDDVAGVLSVDAGALYRILRALASFGIFAEAAERRFQLTPLAEPLRSDAAGSLRGSAMLYGDSFFWQATGALLHTVRTGQTAFDHVLGISLFEYLEQHPEAAALFDQHQTNMTRQDAEAIVAAYDFSGVATLVDVGGGHGTLLASILKAHPAMRGVLFERPSVAVGAKARLDAEEIAKRCQIATGDFFHAVPFGGDAYILKDIIHDWDDERAIAILKHCRQAVAGTPPGKVLVVEKVIPPGNEPFAGKLTDITMLVVTGGRERTEAEYRWLLGAAGFTVSRIVPTRSPASIVEAVPE